MDQKRDKIRALSDREQAREKLPIFYGGRENFYHGFKEVLGNAVDEINNNYDKGIINVTLSTDCKTISVYDSGRGIPINGETDGVPNYKLLFETLFAGTNYENKDNGKIAVGTNGVGVTVLNYTSSLFKVFSFRDGMKRSLTYVNGGMLEGDLVEEEIKTSQHGSQFIFQLDPTIYTNTIYDPEQVKSIVKHTAGTANKIQFKFKHGEEEQLFKYDNLEEYFNEIATNLTSKYFIGPETTDNRESESNKIQILFASSSEPIQESYLNINWLPNNGTIHDGIIAGIRNFVNKDALDQKLIDKKSSITVGDVEDSVTYVASILSTNVEYANQTKLSTDKKLYRSIAMDYVKSLLEAFKAEQPKEYDKFIKHIVQVNKFNSKNTAAKQMLKKKLSEKVDSLTNRIEDLIDSDKRGKGTELFVAEGKSALGSIVLARDSEYQAAYPLRGKILNCLKADYATIFKNVVITELVRILGCGIETDKKNKDLGEFNIENMNYENVVIATDADPDGQQIACLIITMFYKLMPQLIKEGRIFIAQTPLYKLKLEDDTMVYYFSENEKDEKLPKVKGKYTISRCKGLGELDAYTMAYTAMDKETRNLVQVDMSDAEEMVKAVETFMGIDVQDRKEYIEENLHKYILEAE